MFKIKKKSSWKWVTSGGRSASVLFVSAGTGGFVLESPDHGTTQFDYVSASLGLSRGGSFSAEYSTAETFSAGSVYISQAFRGDELRAQDFEGYCLTGQVAVGAGLGASGTVMLLGIPNAALVPIEMAKLVTPEIKFPKPPPYAPGRVTEIFNDFKDTVDPVVNSQIKALLVMGGFNAGPQFTVGISGGAGRIWIRERRPPPPPQPPGPRPIRVTEISINELIIHVPGDVLFDFDKSNIRREARATLEQVAKLIQQRAPRRIAINGHTDSIGGDAYNLALSNRRARLVAQWLVSHRAGNAANITTRGWGEMQPVKPTKNDGSDDREARALNRRVEIYLIK